ncbi:MAG: hypothetical protein QM695_15260 [Micropruina sp.]
MSGTAEGRRGVAVRALLTIAGTALAATVMLGVVGAVRGPVLPAPTVPAPTVGPASFLPSPPAQRVSVDPVSRRLTVEPYLTGQLPGKPFTVGEPTYTRGLFAEATLVAWADDPGWVRDKTMPVSLIVADLEPKTVVVGDLDATGRGVLAEVAARLYRTLTDLQVSDVRNDPETTIGPYPARWSHAHVTGTLPHGGTEQVDLSMLLVALPNRRHFALIELRPDHPGAAALFPALDRAAASVAAVG